MRDEDDFTSYAAARWQRVICTLVLLGVPPRHAPVLARRAFARCRELWEHHDAFDDLDAELYRTVLECKQRDRTAWWEEPAFEDEAWAEVEPALDRLTPRQRSELLLRQVAGLPDAHVLAVAGEQWGGVGAPTGDQLREVARVVPVDPPDLDEIVALAHRHRRRRRDLVQAAVAGSVVVVAVVAVLLARGSPAERSSEPDLDPVPVQRVGTDSPVPWYADGRLHLSGTTLELPGVTAAAAVNSGAVYRDSDDELLFVSDQGERTRLAAIGEDGTFLADDEDGLVAWLPEGEDPELVVHDLTLRDDVLRLVVGAGAELIALDAGSVFYREGVADFDVVLDEGEPQGPVGTGLLDVSSKVRVLQETRTTIRAVQPLFDLEFVLPGTGAQLSADGNLVLTEVSDGLLATPERTVMYDARSGNEVETHLARTEDVVDARFGPEATITYLLRGPTTAEGTLELRTCNLRTVYLPSGEAAPECASETVVIGDGVPFLAR